MKRIYLLERTEEIEYGEADGFVTVAENPEQARQQATDRAGDEGGAWLDPGRATCREIKPGKESYGVILRSFRAG